MKVVIIGAGVAGLSIGWRLLQQGAEVTILERAQPGKGATWASAGMIAVLGESGDNAGPDAELAKYSGSLWPAFAHEIEEASGRNISFRTDGVLLVAGDISQAELLERRAATSGAKFLSTTQARQLEPLLGENIAGALYDPDESQVDNRALGSALTVAFLRAGGKLAANESVIRFQFDVHRVAAAITQFGVYHADAFILAAGAWTSRIAGIPEETLPPVVPVKGEMIALAPLKNSTLPTRIVWGHEVYLVPRHDRLFVGATSSRDGYDTRLTDAAAGWLQTNAARVMPELSRWDIVEHWAGLRPGSPDDLPILGETTVKGLFVASGQFRNGILFAPAIAEALSRLVLGQPPPPLIAAFDPKRFVDKALLANGGPVG
jgi:glycine oxidase